LPAARMEGNVVNVVLMARQGTHQAAVRRGPKLDEMVVAARCQQPTIGVYRQRADPAVVCVVGFRVNRGCGVNRPAEDFAVIIAGKQPASLKSQGANPASMSREGQALA